MKITFDCPDKINGVMTMVIEPADYQEKVEKTLKDYRKKAQVPGFRPVQIICNSRYECYHLFFLPLECRRYRYLQYKCLLYLHRSLIQLRM